MTPREQLLDELRPVSFGIAYRMLGSVSEAEDVVQEALLRVHKALEAGEEIASPRAFVATITTRLAINEFRSARVRRERYVGEWLPEPIITDGRDDPAGHAETADSLSLAMLRLLESLSPEQRAVLLLHDVFGYGYPEISGIVGKSEDNVRQLASRARRHVEQGRPCSTTCSATATPRSAGSSARARTTCASSPPAPAATWSRAGPASRRAVSSATSWPAAFWRRPSRAISPAWRRSSPTTSC